MPARLTVVLLAVACLVGACGGGGSSRERADPATGVALQRVGVFGEGPDYNQPTDVASAPGDRERLFVVQKKGTIRILRDGRLLPRPFLDLRREITSDQLAGLLALAFAPDYARSGRFYVYFTDRRRRVELAELRRSASDPDVADPASRRRVLRITQRFRGSNDLGGELEFGPDGLLYVSTGDGQFGEPPRTRGTEQSQRLDLLQGKILRIDPRRHGDRPYAIPDDNPYVGRDDARPEVLVSGLRNPWRFSFDGTDLWLPDLGQGAWEEVNRLAAGDIAGTNLGWPGYEGRHRFDAKIAVDAPVAPVFEYPHRAGGQCGGAIIGGYVVRDRSLPALDGRYVYGDWCKRTVRSFDPRDPVGTDAPVDVRLRFVSSFGRDADGHVYVADDVAVYRLVAPGTSGSMEDGDA